MEVKIEYDKLVSSDSNVFGAETVESSASTIAKKGDAMNYRQVYVDVDIGKKSDRQEWAHLRYQTTYRPDEAFEIMIQWVQATGTIITELVMTMLNSLGYL
jgi:hypothetical protein